MFFCRGARGSPGGGGQGARAHPLEKFSEENLGWAPPLEIFFSAHAKIKENDSKNDQKIQKNFLRPRRQPKEIFPSGVVETGAKATFRKRNEKCRLHRLEFCIWGWNSMWVRLYVCVSVTLLCFRLYLSHFLIDFDEWGLIWKRKKLERKSAMYFFENRYRSIIVIDYRLITVCPPLRFRPFFDQTWRVGAHMKEKKNKKGVFFVFFKNRYRSIVMIDYRFFR